jgi:glycosyltransferase involved in cell wall biosynthesis
MLSANQAWNLVNFRSALITHYIDAGYRVLAVAPYDEKWSARLTEMGCEFAALPMRSSGLSPFSDARTFFRMWRLLRRFRPTALLSWTIKPNLYGALAARFADVRAIPNISGLGTVFIKSSPVTAIAMWLYRYCLRQCPTVFFQNEDDRDLFLQRNLVSATQARVLPGSGVDLDHFRPESLDRPKPRCFLMIARLVADKGVREFVRAAAEIRTEFPDVNCILMGAANVDNRTAIDNAELQGWIDSGAIVYAPPVDDVRPAIRSADWVVLPSYREGRPKVLLEASAMARPAIATDVPGCKDVIIEGETGFLVPVADARSLADAMRRALDLSDERWGYMARNARQIAEKQFAPKHIIRMYDDALAQT